MKKLWLLAVLITPLQLIHSQEVHHAPTVEQCRADQRLWLSKLEEGNGSAIGVASIGYFELNDWTSEMLDCEKVDPGRQFQYMNTEEESNGVMQRRLQNFLVRHNLFNQFLAEDAQGKR